MPGDKNELQKIPINAYICNDESNHCDFMIAMYEQI